MEKIVIFYHMHVILSSTSQLHIHSLLLLIFFYFCSIYGIIIIWRELLLHEFHMGLSSHAQHTTPKNLEMNFWF